MKRMVFLLVALFAVSSAITAQDWSPTPMVIDVQDIVAYDFDGSMLDIPFSLSGKNGKLWLVIETKLEDADKPVAIINGFKGWHYVNGIDTTVYVSAARTFDIGANNVFPWDGTGNEKGVAGSLDQIGSTGAVPPGDYTFYLWGYDHQSNRELACDFIPIGNYWEGQYVKFYVNDDQGVPYDRPMMMGHLPFFHASTISSNYDGILGRGDLFKWQLGSDPLNTDLLETSHVAGYNPNEVFVHPDYDPNSGNYSNYMIGYGSGVFDPEDHDIFYLAQNRYWDQTQTVVKYQYVPGGESVQDLTWGGYENNLEWFHPGNKGDYSQRSVLQSLGDDYLVMLDGGQNPIYFQHDRLHVISKDDPFDEIFDIQLEEFYMPDQPVDPSSQASRTSSEINRLFPGKREGTFFISGAYTCLQECIDISRLINAEGDLEPYQADGYVVWANSNGDFFLDMSPYLDPENPAQHWACIVSDPRNQFNPREELQPADMNGFMISYSEYTGLNSFGVYCPDGTGIELARFGDESFSTGGDNREKRGGGEMLDYGGQYDGMYMLPALVDGTGYHNVAYLKTMWIASDSDGGVITTGVPMYTLTMAVDPAEGGTTSPGVGTHNYIGDQVVTISATANNSYEFSHWSGDVEDPYSATTTVTIDSDKTVIAHFDNEADPRIDDLTASVDGSNIILEWSPLLDAETYNVYRGTTWDFEPDIVDGTNRIGEEIIDEDPGREGIQWTDTGNGAQIVGDTTTNYYYRVTAFISAPAPDASREDAITTGAKGIPHTVMGTVQNSDSSTPSNGDIEFTAYISGRPEEVLTEAVPGSGYDAGYWFVNVGNFPTAWAIGEVLHVDFLNTLNGEIGIIEHSLTADDPEVANVALVQYIESVPSNIACEIDIELIVSPTTDINEIVVAVDTRGSRNPLLTAEDLAQAIPNCTVAYVWNAPTQSSTGHPTGMPFNNFEISPGYPYSVNVTENTIWTVAGALPDTTFNLITTATTNINHLSILHKKDTLSTAEELAQDIPFCTVVYQWDAATQSSTGHPAGMPFNNFAVQPYHAYWANVTQQVWWPTVPDAAPIAKPAMTTVASEDVPGPAGGVPHMVFNTLSSSTGMLPGTEQLNLRAWVTDRPDEVLTDDMAGTGIEGDYWWVGVNNFPTPWRIGDTLRVEIMDAENNIAGFQEIVLTDAGYDRGEELILQSLNGSTSFDSVPLAYTLLPNSPNPFNPSTQISYGIPERDQVSIRIYDILGRIVTTLVDEMQEPGYKTIVWNGTDENRNTVSAGIYLLEMVAPGYRDVHKMMFIK